MDPVLKLRTAVLLGAFTVVDGVACLLHGLRAKGVLSSRFFELARDRGFAELIQYGKCFLIILMLRRWNRIRNARLLSAWVILFAVILADDAMGIHEEVGGWLMQMIEFPAFGGLRTKDIAEAVVFAMLEGCACVYVLFSYFRAPRDLQSFARGLGLAMLPLVLSGLVLD